jgi:hypothetical protein
MEHKMKEKEQQMSGLVASEGRAGETGYEQWLSR